ncbi:BPI fold-containing family B, member 9B [Apodemus speciosus]|uniref:BPI fold-containing family B, member 9B n=1 Tax=Apodemus speciosus TaxID=105296 RepID=A0ABQ0EJ57_APOSI
MLSIQAGTLDLVETPPVVGSLPAVVPGPLNLPFSTPKFTSRQRSTQPSKVTSQKACTSIQRWQVCTCSQILPLQ